MYACIPNRVVDGASMKYFLFLISCFSVPQVLVCQVSCYVAEDQLFQWTEKVRLSSCCITCVSEHMTEPRVLTLWSCAGACRCFPAFNPEASVSRCCQMDPLQTTRRQTTSAAHLPLSCAPFTPLLSLVNQSARRWSNRTSSLDSQLQVWPHV